LFFVIYWQFNDINKLRKFTPSKIYDCGFFIADFTFFNMTFFNMTKWLYEMIFNLFDKWTNSHYWKISIWNFILIINDNWFNIIKLQIDFNAYLIYLYTLFIYYFLKLIFIYNLCPNSTFIISLSKCNIFLVIFLVIYFSLTQKRFLSINYKKDRVMILLIIH